MSRDHPEDGGGFLSRWSRLKQEARERPAPEANLPEPEATVPATATPDDLPTVDKQAEPADPAADETAASTPEDLPDVDSLTRDSDFTGFLRADVPAELRKQALRKLWRSDPVFANLDGLNDYDDNYAAPTIVGAAVRTAYDVIKGFAPRDVVAGPSTEDAAASLEGATQHSDAALQYKENTNQQAAQVNPATENGDQAEPGSIPDKIGPLSDDGNKKA